MARLLVYLLFFVFYPDYIIHRENALSNRNILHFLIVRDKKYQKSFAGKKIFCTFAPAKVCIALARCYQYPDKERLNLQMRRSERFFLSGVEVRVAQTLKKKQNIFKFIFI